MKEYFSATEETNITIPGIEILTTFRHHISEKEQQRMNLPFAPASLRLPPCPRRDFAFVTYSRLPYCGPLFLALLVPWRCCPIFCGVSCLCTVVAPYVVPPCRVYVQPLLSVPCRSSRFIMAAAPRRHGVVHWWFELLQPTSLSPSSLGSLRFFLPSSRLLRILG